MTQSADSALMQHVLRLEALVSEAKATVSATATAEAYADGRTWVAATQPIIDISGDIVNEAQKLPMISRKFRHDGMPKPVVARVNV